MHWPLFESVQYSAPATTRKASVVGAAVVGVAVGAEVVGTIVGPDVGDAVGTLRVKQIVQPE